jgi:hypothetical protein
MPIRITRHQTARRRAPTAARFEAEADPSADGRFHSLSVISNDGRFELAGVDAGHWHLSITSEAGEAHVDVDVSGGTATVVPVVLEHPVRAHGRVVDATGKPLLGIHVSPSRGHEQFSRSDGTFEVVVPTHGAFDLDFEIADRPNTRWIPLGQRSFAANNSPIDVGDVVVVLP